MRPWTRTTPPVTRSGPSGDSRWRPESETRRVMGSDSGYDPAVWDQLAGQLNRKLAPEIESMYIFASAHYSFLSSTGVKEMATFGGDVSDLVPDGVAGALKERIQR